MVVFVRWLISSEQLPPPGTMPDRAARAPGFLHWLLRTEMPCTDQPAPRDRNAPKQFASWLLSREELPNAWHESGEMRRPPQRFWRWVFGAESLPETERDSLQSIRRDRLFHRLFSSEVCPQREPLPRSGPRGFTGWLLSAETCPQLERTKRRRRKGFLHWLSAREQL